MKLILNKVVQRDYSFTDFLFIKQKLIFKKTIFLTTDLVIFKKNKTKKLKTFFEKNFFQKIVSLSLKKGLKLKFFINISAALKYFFYLFTHNNLNFFSKYKNIYNIYYSFFTITNLFFNINFLLYWLTSLLEPLFTLKCLGVPKKYRKKLKKKFIFNIFFLKKEKRSMIFLKWLYLNTFLFNDKKFFMKFFKSLLDIFLKNKKSNLYLKKIIIYKKIFKKLN